MKIAGIGWHLVVAVTWLGFAGGCAHPPEVALLSPHDLYDKPLVSPGTQFMQAPPPVQRAITAEAGAAEIAQITPFTNQNQVVYAVQFANRWLFPPLYIAADGSVLGPDLSLEIGAPGGDLGGVLTGSGTSAVQLADLLPPEVLAVLRERALITNIAHLARQTWGDRIVYIISFRDPIQNPTLYIQSDGTVLSQKLE